MEYDGEERRRSVLTKDDIQELAKAIRGPEVKFFGFRIQEIVVLCTVAFGIFAFYDRTNATLDGLDQFRVYTQGYMDNSDAFHSDATGAYFKQGKPNDRFDVDKLRAILNGRTHP